MQWTNVSSTVWTVYHPISSPVRTSAVAPATPSRRETGAVTTRPISVLQLWQEALATFSAHSAPFLIFALIGFTAPTILVKLVSTLVDLSEYARTHAISSMYAKPPLTILLIQAGVNMLMLSFARGGITWIALHSAWPSEEGRHCLGFHKICRATFARYPALLAGTLLYGVLITVGIVGMSELTRALEFKRGKMANIWAGPYRAFSDTSHQLLWRGVNALIPDPGPPLAEFIPELSHAIVPARPIAQGFDPRPELFKMQPTETRSMESWLFALGSIALILFAETQLRFRTVMVLKPPRSLEGPSSEAKDVRPRRCVGLFAPVTDSVCFGFKYFGTITVHVWLLRLAFLAVSLCLIEFPLAALDTFILPYAYRITGSFEILPIMRFMSTTGVALINAILLAFSAIYDVRLAMQLDSQISNLQSQVSTSQTCATPL